MQHYFPVPIGFYSDHWSVDRAFKRAIKYNFLFRAINDGPIDTYQLKSLDGQMGEFEIPKQGLFQSLQAGALP